MTRLLASTLMLAGAAWATVGARPLDEEAIRQIPARFEAAWDQRDIKALATLFAEAASLVKADGAPVRVSWELAGITGPEEAPRPLRSKLLSPVAVQQHGPWLIASAHNTSLLANPPPR